jgi:hypothetical protein
MEKNPRRAVECLLANTFLYVRINTYLLASGRFILEQKKYQTHAQIAAVLRTEFLFFRSGTRLSL